MLSERSSVALVFSNLWSGLMYKTVLLGLLIAMSPRFASAATLSCNGCTDVQIWSRMQSASGPGPHYLVDNQSGLVFKFRVDRYAEGRGQVEKQIVELAVEPAVRNYVAFVKANPGRQVHLDARGSFPQNAYQLVESPQSAAAVGAWIKENGYGLIQDFLSVLSAVNL